MNRLVALLCFCFGFCLAAPAVAQAPDGQSKAAAEVLFREGRALLEQGQLEAACAKLDQSLELDRSPGTLLNLADCHERHGRTASAWAEFLEAARLAQDTGWHAGAREAQRRAEALEPTLSRLAVQVREPLSDLVITLDGKRLDAAAVGTPLPIDPGEHALSATAEGRASWSLRVRIAANADVGEVEVPALVATGPGAQPDGDGLASTSETLAAAELDTTDGARDTGGSVLPYVIGGFGVAALATGVVFGLLAQDRYEDAEEACPEHTRCDGAAVDARGDAELNANLSNVGFGVGVVALGVAAVLWLTGGEPEASATTSARAPGMALLPRTGGAALRARF
jgi:tetratricopeptide (TPR) repeat protein